MNKTIFKIINLLFIAFFFLDFSFLPNLLRYSLLWPYFTFSLIIFIFIFQVKFLWNIYFIFLTALFLTILLPLSFIWEVLLLLVILAEIYLLRMLIFDDRINFFRVNFNYLIAYFLFNSLFFLEYNLLAKLTNKEYFLMKEINWKLFIVKLFIGLIIFNFIYRLFIKLKIIKK